MKLQILEVERLQYESDLAELYTKLDEVVIEVADAVAKGDLSENADFDTALRAKELIVKKIESVEHILSNSEVIEPNSSHDIIGLGSVVSISSTNRKFISTFQKIVDLDKENNSKFIKVAEDGNSLTAIVVLMSQTSVFKKRNWILGNKTIEVGQLSINSGIGSMLDGKSYGTYNIHSDSDSSEMLTYKVERYDA